MAEWAVINIDREAGPSPRIIGATYAMEVPGGMLIRSFLQTGCALAFVPAPQMTVAMWIDENKIEHK
jgi:hypothetical protein